MKTRLSRYPLPIRLGLPLLLLLLAGSGGLAVLAAGGFTTPLARSTGGGQVLTGEGYTVVGAVGQPDAGTLIGEGLRVNGGVIGEVMVGHQVPAVRPRVYMPIALRVYPITAMYETEPNDLFSQANPIPTIPASVVGTHDGPAGGGDVFSLELEPGRGVEVTLATGNANGVQLLAYDASGSEILRDYAEPFTLTFNTTYDGAYYLYVFTAPEAENYAGYSLTVRAGGPIPGFKAISAPALDVERLDRAPQVEP